ncbi:MAG TPA: Rad52/Rad22 family DNA repair protein [Rhodothermales bacterium]|nr:Rad52/Rad22 family DNA repair protein [Rhodothermales bacterium]
MENTVDIRRLGDFFTEEDIEWKPITVSKKTNKGLAAAYITNRAIMDRLDEVVGPENWRNEFKSGPDGGVLCGISVRVGDEWVTKWDGAENSDIEPIKGGLSNAMRRAAVQWGIGRYLYRLPSQWVPVDERGRFIQPPRVDRKYLPSQSGDGAETAAQQPPVPMQPRRRAAREESGKKPVRTDDPAAEFSMPRRVR